MKQGWKLIQLIFGGLCLAAIWGVNQSYAQPAQLKIIANPSVKTQSLDKDQARRIFTMYQTNWSNAEPIVVYVLASQNQVHQLFSREVLGLFPYQLDRIWNKLVFSGLGEAPIKVNTEQEMLEKISQQPGAIGYVMSAQLPSDVQVISLAEEQEL